MVCVLGASFAAAQNIESAAKLAYARLSFATQVGVVEEAVRANPSITYDELMKIVAEKSVSFDIHVLSSGDVSKVANVPYSSLDSKPIGEDVILTGPREARYQTEGSPEKRSFSAMPPQWKPGQTVLEDWTSPLGEMLKISDAEQKRTPEQRATQYVSMKVTATLATRSLTHNVLALFAKDGTFLIVDPVTNQSALDFFATHSPFPGTLLETDLRTPAVQRWLSEHAVQADTGNGNVICNLDTLTCGVASGDLKRTPILTTRALQQDVLDTYQQDGPDTKKTAATCTLPIGRCGPKYIWDFINCGCKFVGGSPILIDTRNTGFKLSAPKAGSCVNFDLAGDGQKRCWSWPEAGSGNGWLVYPYRTHPGSKNPDLAVASGKDMFGSMTEQMKIEFLSSPCKEHPETCNQDNGYAALQILKQPSQGGYHDYDNPDESLILSTKDKQWKKLRIWIDENRDGIAQSYELHELSEYDIHNISLNAAMTDRKDEYGNWCRFAAPLNVDLKDVRSWAVENDGRTLGAPHQANAQTCDWFLVNSEHK
jgi:hypothetical protein